MVPAVSPNTFSRLRSACARPAESKVQSGVFRWILKITGRPWPNGSVVRVGVARACFTHRWGKPKPPERCLSAQVASLWLHMDPQSFKQMRMDWHDCSSSVRDGTEILNGTNNVHWDKSRMWLPHRYAVRANGRPLWSPGHQFVTTSPKTGFPGVGKGLSPYPRYTGTWTPSTYERPG